MAIEARSAIYAGCATRRAAKRFVLSVDAEEEPDNRPQPAGEKCDEKMKNVVWLVAATENNLLTTGTVRLPFLDCHNVDDIMAVSFAIRQSKTM